MGTRNWKKFIKRGVLRAVNAVPVSSLTIGSPRRTVFMADGTLEIKMLRPPEDYNERPPGAIDQEIFFKFPPLYHRVQPGQFILELENGRVWGNNGAILTNDDCLVAEVSKEFGPAKFNSALHSIFNRLSLKKPRHFAGTLAVAASPGTDVYAHWFCDVLPRLMLLKQSGWIDAADKILLNYSRMDFQMDSLERMAIPQEKLWNCKDDMDFHVFADRLIVPSYPNEHGTVNPWVCAGVKEIFGLGGGVLDADAGVASSKWPRRVYISRSKAVGRKVLNEDALFSFLEQQYGFVKIFTEDLTMAEKVHIFSQAECVIGPHGGGITNIVFSSKDCKIVDVFPPGDFDTFFWSIANSNELDYYYFFGEGEMPTRENDFMSRNIDIEVDMNKFSHLLNKTNLEKLK